MKKKSQLFVKQRLEHQAFARLAVLRTLVANYYQSGTSWIDRRPTFTAIADAVISRQSIDGHVTAFVCWTQLL